jgi:aspartate carbamoyltransferase catalytic subunit
MRAEVALEGRSFINALDFSPQEYEALFALAEEVRARPRDFAESCVGKLLATLFFEPSTRTRLSFEAAMLRLGGKVLTVADPQTSSVAKGESLADTIRTVAAYADLIVIRHPKEGAAQLAAMYSQVPVINAGDGAREHPTQTLTDLYTIRTLKGRLSELTVAVCGDLRYGRTVHSLLRALSRYPGMRFFLVSPQELRIPDSLRDELLAKGCVFEEMEQMEEALPHADVLYMTRVQKERFFNEEDYLRLRDFYILTTDRLKLLKEDAIIMHPLPRVTEIAYAVDADPRAVYFQQARLGMYVRMALILSVLGVV